MTELNLAEIRNFMLANNCKVTNHALVKHFKAFLTNPDTQNEARKQFKTYVNILATIKNEDGEKYLVLRKKYINEMPSEDLVAAGGSTSTTFPDSPSGRTSHTSFNDFSESSPKHQQLPPQSPRQPPPYRPPPEPVQSPVKVPLPFVEVKTETAYRDCVGEFQSALIALKPDRPPTPPPKPTLSRETSLEQKQEDSFDNKENENKMSVKEAMQKFNQMSQEDTKVPSPMGKVKKQEMEHQEDDTSLIQHPKAKEWLVFAAKGDYQRLVKLASEHPILVKLKDPNSTALHWAAKHGNTDIVKLIAGTYKADVNERTNGGYTALHIANQFGRNDILELLTNVYKANRDLRDFSGKKPHDYQKQMKKLSSQTYSKIKARKKHSEKDLGFLRIGSLNARVKKTTEAFSNFMGVSNKQGRYPGQHHHPHRMVRDHANSVEAVGTRNSAPPLRSNHVDNLHKSWGSADNIPTDSTSMPPPKYSSKKRRGKRDIEIMGLNLPHSTPTTPHTTRSPIGILDEQPDAESLPDSDSDGACGFDSNWSNWVAEHPQTPPASIKPTYI